MRLKTMRISDSPALTPGLLLGRAREPFTSFAARGGVKKYLFYAYGRIALLDGLRILACGKDDNVLVPAYICDVAVEPFYELGIKVRFYRVLTSLQPDIADVRRKIDQKTRAILTVNYFGFPQELTEIQGICRERGLALIEDNAHGFLSRKGGRLLGTFGDIGFSSIWKLLPVPNGAALFLNSDGLVEKAQNLAEIQTSQERFRSAGTGRYLLSSALTCLELRCRFPSQLFRGAYQKFHPAGERDSQKEYENAKVRMPGLSLKVLGKANFDEIIRKRRDNYRFWLDRLGKRPGISPVSNDLPEGVCPQVFPVVVDDADGFEQTMLSRGIYVSRWPYLPREIRDNQEFHMANFLSRHLLVLPVHQGLGRNQLEKAMRD